MNIATSKWLILVWHHFRLGKDYLKQVVGECNVRQVGGGCCIGASWLIALGKP